MILAVTEMDSGRDRGGCVVGIEPDLNASSRFCIDPDRSRIFKVSGEESRDTEGEGVFRVKESALSAIDGDLEGVRTLPLRTEKNDVDAGGGAVDPEAGVAAGVELDSFSKALILWDMPEPRLTFLAIGLACS